MSKVHLIGVCGTGMGQLAVLFRAAGAEVTGSDVAFEPPVGPELERHGVRCLREYREENLGEPDLVVVGNVIRKDNVEAVAAEKRGLRRISMSGALREEFLRGRRSVTVAGTHGKTTTSALCTHLLRAGELEPGWFVGGVPKTLPAGAGLGRRQRGLPVAGGKQEARTPFVLEGDEYDDVYWSKQPKFLDYVGVSDEDVVLLTSVEHDHIDIYADLESYLAAFHALVAKIPAGGILVAYAGDPLVRQVAAACAARVVYYALDGDDVGDAIVTWQGALAPIDEIGRQNFDLFAGGVSVGRFAMPIVGAHNVKNAVGALAVCAEGFSVPWTTLRRSLLGFEGVKRRQDLLAEVGGVRVYDDFAHHPTAVEETLRAFRAKHPAGTLFAVFEPRSATACRSLHQDMYPASFAAATRVVLAPLGRTNVPEADRLDLARVAQEIGPRATLGTSVDDIVQTLVREARDGDTIAVLSNGAFGGLHQKLVEALKSR
jgi:UDP-N-acetylmuramate: L-alanyl-gamma-D-glutamyl-meso-diaminopimelate ligase